MTASALLLVAWLPTAAAGSPPADADLPFAAPAAADTVSLRVPDVPFVAQSEDLCGGAAVSMVLRYWGERGVHAEDFRPLVTGRPAGIATADLLAEVRARGWRARPVPGSRDAVAGHLGEGRPVIALIRVAPDRFHYVVLLALTGERALFHDPARGPYRVLGRGEWSDAWRAAGRWAAVVAAGDSAAVGSSEGDSLARRASTPGGARPQGRSAEGEEGRRPELAASASDVPRSCASLVRAGVRRARAGEVEAGSAALRAAAELCPGRPEPWSELAGIRFRAGSYEEAAGLAARAAGRADGSAYPWRLLGASRYLAGDRRGALRAWNRVGEPVVDHVRIQGLRRTRGRPGLDLLDLAPGTTLTPGRLLRGNRRLSELPALRRARVDYRALEGAGAEVRVAAWERRPPTAGPLRAAGVAIRGLAERTVRLSLPSPTGGGEVVSASWRWTPGRPRVAVEARAPAPVGAVWGVEGYWERQSYAAAAAPGGDRSGEGPAAEAVEERRGAVLSAADWVTGRLRGRAAVGVDRWTDGGLGEGERPYVRAGLGGTWRGASGRWEATARAAAWAPLASGEPSFGRVSLDLRRRLGEPGTGVTGRVRAGFRRASGDAPLALWPGAGTGRGRPHHLRAHPLLEDGRVVGPAFGRALVHAGGGATAWVGGLGPLRAGVAGFVDGAAVADRPDGWRGPRALADAGTGLRVRLGEGGTLRLDAAVGLRDGRTALSAGWEAGAP